MTTQVSDLLPDQKPKDRSKTILTVVAIIAFLAIIAGMMLPALCQAREPARRINCAGNLKQIGLAIIIPRHDELVADSSARRT